MNDKNRPLDDAELEKVSGGTSPARAWSGAAKAFASNLPLNLTGGMKCPCGGTFVLGASAGKYVCSRCGDVLTARAEK